MRSGRLRSLASRRAERTALWLLTSVTTTTSSERAINARRLDAATVLDMTPVWKLELMSSRFGDLLEKVAAAIHAPDDSDPHPVYYNRQMS